MAAQGQAQVAAGSDRLPDPGGHLRSRARIRLEGNNRAGRQQGIFSTEGPEPGCGEAGLSGAQRRAGAAGSFLVAQPLASRPIHSSGQAIGEMPMATGVIAGQQGFKPGAILSRR